MTLLRQKALKPGWLKQPWADGKDFLPLTDARYRTKEGLSIVLNAPLHDVETVLSKALRPGRTLLKVVKYEPSGKVIEAAEEEPPKVEENKPTVGATVSVPDVGCPMPDFPEVDARASRVLETFLSPNQIADYRTRGAFVCVGADTGRNYLICNREGPALMRQQAGRMGYRNPASFRQIFDLDRNMPLCIHDWTVPPPEEMLALKLCLTLPGRETEMLKLPDILHGI